MVAARLGGMTVAELDERITEGELVAWDQFFRAERAEATKAMKGR